jgi:HK97 gp10 family phage protein
MTSSWRYLVADVDIEIVTNIEGLDELATDLEEGSRRAAIKFIRHAEVQASKPLIAAARETAPYLTGRLEGDLHKQSVIDGAAGTLTMRVGPGKDSFYGQFQEFGAPEANVPALHWLEDAARSVQEEVLQTFMDALTEGLEDMKS